MCGDECFPCASANVRPRAIESIAGARVAELNLPYVSVASSGWEYYQVSFSDELDSDNSYFLIQRQFETDDGGLFYVESHELTMCGHFRIGKAELGRDLLRPQIMSQPAKTVQVRFRADRTEYSCLKRILTIMMPAGALRFE